MAELRYYVTPDGAAPFVEWAEQLDVFASARIARAVRRMEMGNFSSAKGVGEGVLEFRIDFGPGYRIYFGRDGDTVVILLTGGTKKRQQHDILTASAFWRDYKRTKRAQQ